VNLKGILPDKAVQYLAALAAQITDTSAQLLSLQRLSPVSRKEADKLYGPAALRAALQVNGSNPLNITGLIGVAAQPQIPAVVKTPSPGAQPGSIVVINNVVNQVVSPGVTTPLGALAVALRDTHANRLANYPASKYSANTLFEESDRGTVTYINRTTSGTVNTSGTAVTWASGDMFSASDLGTGKITINAVVYSIASVTSPTALTLTATAGTQTAVAYASAILQWCWQSGRWQAPYASLPTLGAPDIGLEFFDSTHLRLFVWSQLGGQPAITQPGWTRGQQELPTAAIVPLPYGPGYAVGGWAVCDGGTTTITQDDASTLSVTLPNTINSFLAGVAAGGYSPTRQPATAPTVSGSTDTTSLSLAGATSGSVAAGAGAPATFLTGTGNISPNPHSHTLTGVTTTLTGFTVPYVVIPFYMKL
jgi:hypothetical protein